MIFKPSNREQAIIFIDKQFEKKKWIKVDRVTEAKSLNQVRYAWLVFTIIADETGNTADDIYQHYLERFPVYKTIEVHGEEKTIKISLSKFTQEQASVFIDRVVIDARQEGMIIPNCEDKAAIEAMNYYRQRGLL